MEPTTPEERLRWLEASVSGIAHQLEAISEEIRAADLQPRPLVGYERRLARKLRRQVEALTADVDLLREQIADLRGRPGGRGGA